MVEHCSCLFRLPINIWSVIIHECHVGYAFRTHSNNTDSHWGLSCFAPVSIPIRNRLREGGIASEAASRYVFVVLSIVQGDGRKVCRMVYEFSCSAKLSINIPQPDLWFMYNILGITRLGLSCGLIFDRKVMSIMLYTDNPISGSPFQFPFARLFIFKVNSVSYVKVRCRMNCCFLCIFNQFLSNILLAMSSARQCISKFRHKKSGSLKKHCMGSSSWCKGRLGSLL